MIYYRLELPCYLYSDNKVNILQCIPQYIYNNEFLLYFMRIIVILMGGCNHLGEFVWLSEVVN